MNHGITAVCAPPSNDHGRCCGFGSDGTACACACHVSSALAASEQAREELQRRLGIIEGRLCETLSILGADEMDLGPTLARQRMDERRIAEEGRLSALRHCARLESAVVKAEAERDALREALTMAVQWIVVDGAPIGWSVDRLREALAGAPSSLLSADARGRAQGLKEGFKAGRDHALAREQYCKGDPKPLSEDEAIEQLVRSRVTEGA